MERVLRLSSGNGARIKSSNIPSKQNELSPLAKKLVFEGILVAGKAPSASNNHGIVDGVHFWSITSTSCIRIIQISLISACTYRS